jgi:hypothetical protein
MSAMGIGPFPVLEVISKRSFENECKRVLVSEPHCTGLVLLGL